MPNTHPYTVDLQYRDTFDKARASEAELALICSVLSELMVELLTTADEQGKERYGGRTVRAGIDE